MSYSREKRGRRRGLGTFTYLDQTQQQVGLQQPGTSATTTSSTTPLRTARGIQVAGKAATTQRVVREAEAKGLISREQVQVKLAEVNPFAIPYGACQQVRESLYKVPPEDPMPRGSIWIMSGLVIGASEELAKRMLELGLGDLGRQRNLLRATKPWLLDGSDNDPTPGIVFVDAGVVQTVGGSLLWLAGYVYRPTTVAAIAFAARRCYRVAAKSLWGHIRNQWLALIYQVKAEKEPFERNMTAIDLLRPTGAAEVSREEMARWSTDTGAPSSYEEVLLGLLVYGVPSFGKEAELDPDLGTRRVAAWTVRGLLYERPWWWLTTVQFRIRQNGSPLYDGEFIEDLPSRVRLKSSRIGIMYSALPTQFDQAVAVGSMAVVGLNNALDNGVKFWAAEQANQDAAQLRESAANTAGPFENMGLAPPGLYMSPERPWVACKGPPERVDGVRQGPLAADGSKLTPQPRERCGPDGRSWGEIQHDCCYDRGTWWGYMWFLRQLPLPVASSASALEDPTILSLGTTRQTAYDLLFQAGLVPERRISGTAGLGTEFVATPSITLSRITSALVSRWPVIQVPSRERLEEAAAVAETAMADFAMFFMALVVGLEQSLGLAQRKMKTVGGLVGKLNLAIQVARGIDQFGPQLIAKARSYLAPDANLSEAAKFFDDTKKLLNRFITVSEIALRASRMQTWTEPEDAYRQLVTAFQAGLAATEKRVEKSPEVVKIRQICMYRQLAQQKIGPGAEVLAMFYRQLPALGEEVLRVVPAAIPLLRKLLADIIFIESQVGIPWYMKRGPFGLPVWAWIAAGGTAAVGTGRYAVVQWKKGRTMAKAAAAAKGVVR